LTGSGRPFVLQDESVHHSKVTTALGYLVQGHAERAQQVKDLKPRWRRLDRSSDGYLGYTSRTGKLGHPLGDPVADLRLAYAWLYGDLVHADDITAVVTGHDIDSRYASAVLLVSNLAVMAITTLNLVRELRQDGVVPLDDQVLTAPVVARGGAIELPVAGLAVGPAGTAREDLEFLLNASGGPKSG
jgi:hypothetical protein